MKKYIITTIIILFIGVIVFDVLTKVRYSSDEDIVLKDLEKIVANKHHSFIPKLEIRNNNSAAEMTLGVLYFYGIEPNGIYRNFENLNHNTIPSYIDFQELFKIMGLGYKNNGERITKNREKAFELFQKVKKNEYSNWFSEIEYFLSFNRNPHKIIDCEKDKYDMGELYQFECRGHIGESNRESNIQYFAAQKAKEMRKEEEKHQLKLNKKKEYEIQKKKEENEQQVLSKKLRKIGASIISEFSLEDMVRKVTNSIISAKDLKDVAIKVNRDNHFVMKRIVKSYAIYQNLKSKEYIALEIDPKELYSNNSNLRPGLYLFRKVSRFTRSFLGLEDNVQLLVFYRASS